MARRRDKPPQPGEPLTRSLGDQLKQLAVVPSQPPAAQAPVECPEADPAKAHRMVHLLDPPPANRQSFAELIDAVAPIAAKDKRLSLDHLPPQAQPLRLPPRPKLWVEQVEGHVYGLAEGVSRRTCQDLELGRIVPRRELDLHRLSAGAAREALAQFVRQSREGDVDCVLVVVGRGTHSGEVGAVLPDVVVQHLAEALASEVEAFASAPRKWGGQGAVLILLKRSPSLAP